MLVAATAATALVLARIGRALNDDDGAAPISSALSANDADIGRTLPANAVCTSTLEMGIDIGDLSAVLPGISPCGRTNHRIRGWLGRADQTTKVRGMFVHPEQVADIMRRHGSILRARLIVERPAGSDEMTLLIETGEPAEDRARIAETVQAVTKLRGTVSRVPAGSLPGDGKLIEDRRNLN